MSHRKNSIKIEMARAPRAPRALLALLALSLGGSRVSGSLLELPRSDYGGSLDDENNFATTFNQQYNFKPSYATSQLLSPLASQLPGRQHALHRPQVRSLSLASSYLNQLLSDAAAAQSQPSQSSQPSQPDQPSQSSQSSQPRPPPLSLPVNQAASPPPPAPSSNSSAAEPTAPAQPAQHSPAKTEEAALSKPELESPVKPIEQPAAPVRNNHTTSVASESGTLSGAAQISSAQSAGEIALQILRPRKGENAASRVQGERHRHSGGSGSSLSSAEQSIIEKHAFARLNATTSAELSTRKASPSAHSNTMTFGSQALNSSASSTAREPAASQPKAIATTSTSSSISKTPSVATTTRTLNHLWPSKVGAAKLLKSLVSSAPANELGSSNVNSNGKLVGGNARADWSLGALWPRWLARGSGLGQALGAEPSRASGLVKAIGESELSRTLSSVGKALGSNKYVAGTAAASVLAALGLTVSKLIATNRMAQQVPFAHTDPLAAATSNFNPRYSPMPGSLVTSPVTQFGDFATPSLPFGAPTLYESEFERLPAGGFLYTPMQASSANYPAFEAANSPNQQPPTANTYVRYVESQDMESEASRPSYQPTVVHRQHQRRNAPRPLNAVQFGPADSTAFNTNAGQHAALQVADSDLGGHYVAHYAHSQNQQQPTHMTFESQNNLEKQHDQATSSSNNNKIHLYLPPDNDRLADQSFSSSTLSQRATLADNPLRPTFRSRSSSSSGWQPSASARRSGSMAKPARQALFAVSSDAELASHVTFTPTVEEAPRMRQPERQQAQAADEKTTKDARLESLIAELSRALQAGSSASMQAGSSASMSPLTDQQIISSALAAHSEDTSNKRAHDDQLKSSANNWMVSNSISELTEASSRPDSGHFEVAFDGALEGGVASAKSEHLAPSTNKDAWRQVGQDKQQQQGEAAVQTTTLQPGTAAAASGSFSYRLSDDSAGRLARQARSVRPPSGHHNAINNNFILVSPKDLAIEINPSTETPVASKISNNNKVKEKVPARASDATLTRPANEPSTVIQLTGAYGPQELHSQPHHRNDSIRLQVDGGKENGKPDWISIPILKQQATKRQNSTVTAILHNFDKNCEICRQRLDVLVKELTKPRINNTTKN